MPEKIVARVSFIGPEAEQVRDLMAQMFEPTAQSLIRTLVKQKHESVRGAQLRYGPKGSGVPRETKEDRRKRLLALPDEDLTAELKEMGALEDTDYGNGNQVLQEIGLDSVGVRRVLYFNIDSAGNRTDGGQGQDLETILNKLSRKGTL